MKFYQISSISLIILLTMARYPIWAQSSVIDSLHTRLSHPVPDTTQANVLYQLANAFYRAGRPDSATTYLTALARLSYRTNYQSGLGDYNRLQGVIWMHQGLFEKSLIAYQKAITHYTKAKKLTMTAAVYSNMGWLYKMMGDSQHVLDLTRQGLHYMQQAIAINQRSKPSSSLVSTYINTGIIYEDLGQYQLGREYFLKGIAINDQLKAGTQEYPVLYNNLGKNYNVTGQYQLAITYLQKALAINQRLNKLSSLAHNYRNLATSYIGLGQPDSAVYYAEKSLAVVKAAKESPLTNSIYRELALSYASAGQFQKAYEAVSKHKRVEDSLMTLDKTRTIAQLQGRYALEQANTLAAIRANLKLNQTRAIALIEAKKASEIAAIQAEKTNRIAQIKATAEVEKAKAVVDMQTKYATQKRLQQIAQLDQRNQQRGQQLKYMTGGLTLLLVLLGGLIAQYSIIRQTNRRLSVQNGIITTSSQQLTNQANELRVLMKELHHRVKNNLAIVSSLLKLQIKRLDDERAIQAMQIGQQRIEAISMIHQRLYQTDQLTSINMAEYFTDLADSLIQAYGYQRELFDLQIEVDLPEVDVDVAIPLGLIVNELATNAFKYAFQDAQRPQLRIALHQHKPGNQTGLILEVQDNGPGIVLVDGQPHTQHDSFGKRLIYLLSEQLDGQIKWIQQDGTLFRLSF